jgi:hypothetical protein
MDDGVESIGTLATGGIIAREIDRAHAPGHTHETACLNCGHPLEGQYCSSCGQGAHVHRTAMALLHDIAHGVFHFEGRIWHTLPMLVTRPGELTRRYVHGERAKFVSPMALFLFSVFLMFAVTSSITKHWDFGGAAMIDVRKDLKAETRRLRERVVKLEARRDAAALPTSQKDDQDPKEIATHLAAARLELANTLRASAVLGATIPEGADGFTSNTGSDWLDEKLQHARENPKLLIYKVKTAAYKYSWALIPISLPFIWLLFPLRRGVGMYDHAIFATYSLSFMMLFGTVLVGLSFTGLEADWLWLAFMIVPPVHMFRQLRGAYLLGRFGAAWRTFALLVMVSITAALFFMLLLYLGVAG